MTCLKVGNEIYPLKYFKRSINTGTPVSGRFFIKLMLKTQRLKAPCFQLFVTAACSSKSVSTLKTYSVYCKCEQNGFELLIFAFFNR